MFRTGFFTLYALQSAADIADYGLALVYVRLASMGYVSQALFNYPQGNFAYIAMTYVVSLQFVAHPAIAFNRFLTLTDYTETTSLRSVLRLDDGYDYVVIGSDWQPYMWYDTDCTANGTGGVGQYEAWSTRKQRLVVMATLLIPLPNAALRFIGHMQLVPTSVPGTYAIVRDVRWMTGCANITVALFSSVTSAISVFFEVRSLIAYRKLPLLARKRFRNDFLLLIYALLQFLVQLAVSICYGFSTYGWYVGDAQLASVWQTANKYIVDVLCLSPPICILSTSRLLRKVYAEMYWPFEILVSLTPPSPAAPKPVRRINAINITLGVSRTC